MNLHENIRKILREETSVKDFDYEKKNSDVHGIGLFATKNINKKQKGLMIKVSNKGYLYTNLGKYMNHSKTPNVKLVLDGSQIMAIPLRDIKKGEEIVCDYDKNPFGFQGSEDLKDKEPFSHCKVSKIKHDTFNYLVIC
jgi:SET domain-containing protein